MSFLSIWPGVPTTPPIPSFCVRPFRPGCQGDLGAIHEKYDVAISTACGPLDNIVVDSVDTAQRCIQFLKQNSIGTATFIALDKMEKWRAHTQTPIQTPENVPRLFDLVQVKDERVRTAFYYALRDTLVAEDLTQATRIGYGRQRHRVVTLRGDLIETSGQSWAGDGARLTVLADVLVNVLVV